MKYFEKLLNFHKIFEKNTNIPQNHIFYEIFKIMINYLFQNKILIKKK